MISGMSLSQNDAIRILDRSVILLLTHFSISSAQATFPIQGSRITHNHNDTYACCGMKFSPPRCFYAFSCGCASSAKISNHIELHYTYIHQQHCISVSNQHGANLEAVRFFSLSSNWGIRNVTMPCTVCLFSNPFRKRTCLYMHLLIRSESVQYLTL